MRKLAIATACGVIGIAGSALADAVNHVSYFFAGGQDNGMRVYFATWRFVIDGHVQSYTATDLTMRDCHGSHDYVHEGRALEINRNHFVGAGRGDRESYHNGKYTFLHSYKHWEANGQLNGSRGSVTYTIAGCGARHATVVRTGGETCPPCTGAHDSAATSTGLFRLRSRGVPRSLFDQPGSRAASASDALWTSVPTRRLPAI